MIVERVEHPQWLSNAYLVADEAGGHGVLVDSNGLERDLEERAARDRITITHVLCTHGHADHVLEIDELARRVGAPLVAHPGAPVAADVRVDDSSTLTSGGLEIRALYTPGHCRDHVAYLIGETHCLTGDVLFRDTVGGTSGADGDLGELKHSIFDVLFALAPETVVLPGHREATTIGRERDTNPFVRAWVSGEGLTDEPCRVSGEPATLLLWAADYDGGYKALVRYPSGHETIVGGSRVQRG